MNLEIIKAVSSNQKDIMLIENDLDTKILSLTNIQDVLLNSNSICYLARLNGEFIGYIAADILVDHIDILSIAVKKAYRKQNVATYLLQELFKHATANNIYEIFLEVRPSNISAIAFYEKNCFCKIHTRKNYYPNGEDALIYKYKS